MLKRLTLILALCLVWPLAAGAVAVDKPLPDPALEARAHNLHKELRCLVCQNQSIEDSNADLARDLRMLVRERIAAGDTDEEALAFIVERYGDWVLMQPPVKTKTILLWSSPLILIGFGAILTFFWFRRRRAAGAPAGPTLSAEERERVRRLLDDGDAS